MATSSRAGVDRVGEVEQRWDTLRQVLTSVAQPGGCERAETAVAHLAQLLDVEAATELTSTWSRLKAEILDRQGPGL